MPQTFSLLISNQKDHPSPNTKTSMAASMNLSFLLFVSFSLFLLQGIQGEIVCEELSANICAFSIASSGKRCLLEKKEGKMESECRTSEVLVERMSEHIESNECVSACGVDRNTAGISSDAFFEFETRFAAKLCSSACYQNCPNIVDLYFNLAAAEGVFLPILCETQMSNPHRAMVELISTSGAGAPGPMVAVAP